jgi:RimJ/RimL family protein N-acetyltransferase
VRYPEEKRGGAAVNIEIRALAEADLPLLLKWLGRGGRDEYMHRTLPRSASEAEAWYSGAGEGRLERMVELYGTPIGFTGLRDIEPPGGAAEFWIFMGEVGYNNIRSTAGAAELMLKAAFHELRLSRVYLYAEAGNSELRELMARSGFRAEGPAGGRIVMSITREAFLAREGTF